jgi:hypothetical protein
VFTTAAIGWTSRAVDEVGGLGDLVDHARGRFDVEHDLLDLVVGQRIRQAGAGHRRCWVRGGCVVSGGARGGIPVACRMRRRGGWRGGAAGGEAVAGRGDGGAVGDLAGGG